MTNIMFVMNVGDNMKKEIENAKENFKKRKNIRRLSVKPIKIRGTEIESDEMFNVNGNKMFLVKCGKNDYDFIKLR